MVAALVGDGECGWTFSRAVDACISVDRAWRELRRLPGLDAVLTAGSPRGVAEGLDELVARAESDPFARSVIMAGGGLLPEHVPWLTRAGVRAFQVGAAVRPLGSTKAYVDPDLVRTWRRLVDAAMTACAGAGVTVYIDPPTWPGHGRLWSHLVSDTSYEELHAFAAELGIPRRAFERDHYDVVAERYAVAVAAGARPATSREIVARLHAAGLRRRKVSRLAR